MIRNLIHVFLIRIYDSNVASAVEYWRVETLTSLRLNWDVGLGVGVIGYFGIMICYKMKKFIVPIVLSVIRVTVFDTTDCYGMLDLNGRINSNDEIKMKYSALLL